MYVHIFVIVVINRLRKANLLTCGRVIIVSELLKVIVSGV